MSGINFSLYTNQDFPNLFASKAIEELSIHLKLTDFRLPGEELTPLMKDQLLRIGKDKLQKARRQDLVDLLNQEEKCPYAHAKDIVFKKCFDSARKKDSTMPERLQAFDNIVKKMCSAAKGSELYDFVKKHYSGLNDPLWEADKKSWFYRHVKHLIIEIEFDEALNPECYCWSTDYVVSKIFTGLLPIESRSLELIGRNALPANNYSGVESILCAPNVGLSSLTLKNWPIHVGFNGSSISALTEFKVVNAVNEIKDVDLVELKNSTTLKVLELDASLGLTSYCFEHLPSTLTRLFIAIHDDSPSANFSKLPLNLNELKIEILKSKRSKTANTEKYRLKLEDVKNLPKELTYLSCPLSQNITLVGVQSYLKGLKKLDVI